MKRNCTGKSFKLITNFYCYNCRGYGHKVVECKKPKFDGNNAKSRIFRITNPTGNERERSQSRYNDGEKSIREKNQFVCYKFNNPKHIARNCKASKSQNETN